jgi:hypothetical protein
MSPLSIRALLLRGPLSGSCSRMRVPTLSRPLLQPASTAPSVAPSVSIRQHTSAYVSVSIRQHTSAYGAHTCSRPCFWLARSNMRRSYVLTVMNLNLSAYASIRQHTSAYVSIRQHTSACVSIRRSHVLKVINFDGARLADAVASRLSASAGIRQHTSAYVSIRHHTPAYVSIRQHTCRF